MRLIDADRLLKDISDFPYGYRGMIKAVIANQPTIYPSAGYRVLPVQSEPLTDKEQRIFLAAMGREEEVCKQVDAECRDCREPYEDTLVSVCHEINRKVKDALWTI